MIRFSKNPEVVRFSKYLKVIRFLNIYEIDPISETLESDLMDSLSENYRTTTKNNSGDFMQKIEKTS